MLKLKAHNRSRSRFGAFVMKYRIGCGNNYFRVAFCRLKVTLICVLYGSWALHTARIVGNRINKALFVYKILIHSALVPNLIDGALIILTETLTEIEVELSCCINIHIYNLPHARLPRNIRVKLMPTRQTTVRGQKGHSDSESLLKFVPVGIRNANITSGPMYQ